MGNGMHDEMQAGMRERMLVRLVRASLLVGLVLVVPLVAEPAINLAQGLLAGQGASMPTDDALGEGDPYVSATNGQDLAQASEFLESIGQGQSSGVEGAVAESSVTSILPVGFESEAFSVGGFDEVMATSDGKIVGLQSGRAALEVFDDCAVQLEARGWTRVSSGSALQSTFLKEEGAFRWMFLSCSSVGGGCSAVVYLEKEGGA